MNNTKPEAVPDSRDCWPRGSLCCCCCCCGFLWPSSPLMSFSSSASSPPLLPPPLWSDETHPRHQPFWESPDSSEAPSQLRKSCDHLGMHDRLPGDALRGDLVPNSFLACEVGLPRGLGERKEKVSEGTGQAFFPLLT